MKPLMFLFGILLLCTSNIYVMQAVDFQVGHVQKTFVDSTRTNRQVSCEIYYPAVTAGNNTPIATGKYPVLVFGHGFVMPTSVYDIYWNALVPKGYILVLPNTESSFSPSHSNFGKDIAFITKAMKDEGNNAASFFFNTIANQNAVMGHSMGGGCAFLAMQYDPSITAMVSFAAAVTNPSSITAANTITKPSLVFSGENDCVAPPQNHQIPMYDSLKSSCKSFISIKGADHCQFASYNFNCSLGQNTCTPKATINAMVQQNRVFELLLPWLQYQLKGDCSAGLQFNDLIEKKNGISTNQNCSLSISKATILGTKQPCLADIATDYSVSNDENYAIQWTVASKGIILGAINQNTVQIVWKKSGIDTLKVRRTNPVTGCYVDTMLIVSIQTLPKSVISGNSACCKGFDSVVYSVTQEQNMQYQWSTPLKGGIVGSSTSSSVSITWNDIGLDTVRVLLTNSITGCSKDTFLVVSISEIPENIITGKDNVCNGIDYTYAIQSYPNIAIQWGTLKNGKILGGDKGNSAIIRWTSIGNDTIRVSFTDTKTGCKRDTILPVTILESPHPEISGPSNVCEGTVTAMYRMKNPNGNLYQWKSPKNGKLIGNNIADSVFVQWMNIGKDSIVVRETNKETGCFHDTSFMVSIYARPIPIINGTSTVNEFQKNIPYSVNQQIGSQYQWSIISGDGILSDTNQYQTKLQAGKKGTIVLQVKEISSEGCINADTFSVKVQPFTHVLEEEDAHLLLYPNPLGNSDLLSIQNTSIDSRIISIEIINALGNKVHEISNQIMSNTISISTSTLVKGLYFAKINMHQSSIIRPFLK